MTTQTNIPSQSIQIPSCSANFQKYITKPIVIPKFKSVRPRCLNYWAKREKLKFLVAEECIDESVDNRPYTDVIIADTKIRGLLDSGATISVLGSECHKILETGIHKVHKIHSQLETASGQKQRVVGYIYVPISFNGKTKMITLFLVPSLKQKLYLGIDFWKLFDLKPIQQVNEVNLESLPDTSIYKYHILTDEQRTELNRVKELFPSYAKEGIGRTSLLTHTIDTGDVQPIKQRYFPVSPAIQKLMYQELDRMISLDVIEESHSGWSSPITLVRKTNGTVRLCLDARKLNSVTVKDAYPIPIIEGLLSRLDQTHYITSIDLKDAFWQIPLEEKSREKTAFTVPGRPLFQFKVMPFGLCNAPQTLCRLMHKVISSNLHDQIFVYLDDLLVTSKTFADHLKLLEHVAEQLRKAHLTINMEKSRFLLKETKYLGYIVADGCLKPDPIKVDAIASYPTPKTVRQLRRFIGMCGWYRKFVQNFATLAAPLTNLLSKQKKIDWSESADRAFKKLKEALTTAPILTHPDFNKRFFIQCDASSTGIGSVLFQRDENNLEHPIYYFSQKLSKTQRNYSVTELECFAAVVSVQKFRPYVEGLPFTIITDHASLKWLMSQKDLTGRLARWSLKLQGFDFEIEFRKGNQNIVPDSLSRIYGEELYIEEINQVLDSELPSLNIDLNSTAFTEPEYINQLEKIRNSTDISNFRVYNEKLYFHPGGEYYDFEATDIPKWKLVVPRSLTLGLITSAHNSTVGAHLGIAKTLEVIKRTFFWSKMTKDVSDYIRNCSTCKQTKPVNYITRPNMGEFHECSRPWQQIYVDFLGPYPRTAKSNTCIFIVLDKYSKYVLLKALPEASSKRIVEYLEENVFKFFSVPEYLFSDNGRQFEAHIFKDLLEKYSVKHITTPMYSPQANASERVNRTIISALRAYLNENHRNWDMYLNDIRLALVNVVHSATGYSPQFLTFGQHLILHGNTYSLLKELDLVSENSVSIVPKEIRLSLAHEHVLKHLRDAYARQAVYYNLRSTVRNFSVGQEVYVRNFAKSDAAANFVAKLGPKFLKGIISRIVGNVSYEIKDPQGKILGIYHAKDIRL